MSTAGTLRPSDRVAVLWGGGLGDALAIRPLLQRLSARLERPPLFCCASFARQGVFAELGVRVEEVPLPAQAAAAVGAIRALGPLDLVYLGPHPTWKTRLLASAMRAERVWHEPGATADEFVADTVCRDIRRLGLAAAAEAVAPYGTLPLFAATPAAGDPAPRELIVHLAARPHWEAKQWPADRWAALLERLAQADGWRLVCVGTPDEAPLIEAALQRLTAAARARVGVETGLTTAALEQRVRSSGGVVCHNSGIMHLAAAHQRPTVVLAGSSSRFWWPSMPWVKNLTSGRCGLACNQRRCPVPFYDARCIRELPVDTVLDVVRTHILTAP